MTSSLMTPAPRSARRAGVRAAVVIGLAAAAAVFFGADTSEDAFTSSRTPFRLGAGYVEMDELPQGLTCRASYGGIETATGNKPKWNPIAQWRGEKSYHASRELQQDKYRQWYHFDAEGKVLGRLAQEIANVLRGKHSRLYDPIRDVGNFVVVTNCEKVRVSGKKYHHKLYFRNLSFRPGHTLVERFKDLQRRFPERILMRAIWGQMPKTKSCRRIFKDRLKLFTGANHLYYDKEPIEYPMHKIKDCTHTQNLRLKDRVVHWVTTMAPKMADRVERKEAIADENKLEAFKLFLKQHVEDTGPEAAERLELDTLIEAAEMSRMDKILKANEGREVPKREVPLYLGLNIPKKKIDSNIKRGRSSGA